MPSISGQHSIVLLIKDIVSSAFDQENDALHEELEKAAVLPGPLFIHSICYRAFCPILGLGWKKKFCVGHHCRGLQAKLPA